jgi:hypothetical protein
MNPVNIAVNTSYPGAVKQVKQGPETRPETVEDPCVSGLYEAGGS